MIFPLVRLLLWFPFWLVGLLLLLLGLALSPWGASWLVSQGEQRGLFSVDSITGAPLDDLTVNGLILIAGTAHVQIGRLNLAWADDCLLDGKLCLDILQLENVDVRIDESSPAQEQALADDTGGGGMPSISVPFPIELRALELRNVDVRLADGTRLSWQRFTSGARLAGDTFTLLPTRLVDSELRLPLSSGQTLAMSDDDLIDPALMGEEEPITADIQLTADAIDAAIAATTPAQIANQDPDAAAQDSEAKTPLTERERLTLPEIKLPMAINVPSLVVSDFRVTGPTRYAIERLALSLKGHGHDIRLHSLALASADADAKLAASVSLRNDYPLDMTLDARIHRQPLADERVVISLEGSLSDLSASLDAKGPVAARLQVQADVLAPILPFEATLNAERLEWPLAASSQEATTIADEAAPASDANEKATPRPTQDSYVVQDLALRTDGDLAVYRVALSAAVSGTALPEEVRMAMTGEGDLERFAWTPLALSADNGALISRGEVRWAPSLEVETTLNLDRFSLDALTDVVSGQLSGDAQVNFAMDEEGGWQLGIPQLAIDGTLQDRPLLLEAQLKGNSEMRWVIEQLRLRQGENRLVAQGRVADTMDLAGELDAPALATLLPELGGSAQGRFTVAGTFEAPQLDLSLTGRNLRYVENVLESLQLEVVIAGLEDPQLDVTLDVSGLDVAGQRFSRLGLDLGGRLSRHRLDLSADAAKGMPLSRAALDVEGGLNADRSRYRGRLASLEIDSEQAELRLEEPTAFDANLTADSVEAVPFCLVRRQGGSLCSTETLQASSERGRVVLALREFPMDLVSAALPEAWSAEGQSDGQLEASWSSGGQWSAQADLESRLALSGEDAYGQPWSLPASTLVLTLDVTPAEAQLQSQLALSEAGRLQLDLSIADPAGTATLDGRLRVDNIRLSPYRTLTTGLQQLEGALNGDVILSGALGEPRLDGSLRLAGLRAQGGDLPVEVRGGQLDVQLQGSSASLAGFVEAEEGRLELQGDARWPEPGEWAADLSLDGTESPLLVVLPEFGRLRVAPDLAVTASPELLRIRGQVRVPWGRLTIAQSPPSAISPSSDEVIITREDEARAQQEARRAVEEASEEGREATAQALAEAGMRLDVVIELILGPDVQLEAFGLEAELAGQLEVRQSSGPVQLFGDINLVDGRYQAFGQDLIIRQGQVLFSGPASQPRLQFEAIRNPDVTEDDVLAGLRVTGPADQPQLSIFSEPAMDEGRALSYLLRGRAPDDTGGADGALTSALIGLSLSRTGGAVGQVGQAFGINDLSLESAGSGEESQVVVSGYLFEDLKVSYGVGIFSPIAELTLRYKLFQNLYLEAISGAAQAVDLIYTFSLGRSSLGRSNASP